MLNVVKNARTASTLIPVEVAIQMAREARARLLAEQGRIHLNIFQKQEKKVVAPIVVQKTYNSGTFCSSTGRFTEFSKKDGEHWDFYQKRPCKPRYKDLRCIGHFRAKHTRHNVTGMLIAI